MRTTYTPFDYQVPMEAWLRDRREAALFASPGLGKTVVTLAAFEQLVIDGATKGMLFTAPLRVCSISWPDQVEKWDFCDHLRIANLRTEEGLKAWHDHSADIYVINPEKLPTITWGQRCPRCRNVPADRRHCLKCGGRGKVNVKKYPGFVDRYLKGKRTEDLPVDMICHDEISLAKASSGVRYGAIRVYRDLFKRHWGLTGTPVPNSYLDLWAQVRLLDGGERLTPSYTHYRDRYFRPTGYGGYTWVPKAGAEKEIQGLIADLALTMLGDDYLDVPTCHAIDEEVELKGQARQDYETLKKELLLELERGDVEALHAAALTTKLLQLTGGSVYDSEGKTHVLHDTKLARLKKLLKRHEGEPVLVLVKYDHERQRILRAFPQAERFDEKDMGRWKAGKVPVWVAHPRSMSHGIDGMQEGGRIAVWMTPTYSSEEYDQTNARLIRTGQSHETIVYRILAKDTIDEAVVEALRAKGNRQAGLLQALKNLQRMERTKITT